MNPPHPSQFTYKVLQVNDVPWENLGKHFMDSALFIQKAIKSGGVVFVHCWAGISRSTSCIAAYLMVEYGMTLAAALSLIKQGRNRINPNPGFRKQLQEFERKVKKLRAEGRIDKPSEIQGQIGGGPNGLGEGLII